MDKIFKIAALPALRDNYIWVVHHQKLNQCVVVDPGEALPVLHYLDTHQATLSAILITHHHADHTQGINALKERFPETTIYGSAIEPIPHITKTLHDKDGLSLLNNQLTLIVCAVPGHTLGHIAYYTPGMNGVPAVFTGDTLFAGGCGRLLEGTPSQLYQSLTILKSLPDNTQVYCGHEYTVSNLTFAHWLEPDNLSVQSALKLAKSCRDNQKPTLPSLISKESIVNPFLRCDEKTFIVAMKKRLKLPEEITTLDLFTHLRHLKDNWHG